MQENVIIINIITLLALINITFIFANLIVIHSLTTISFAYLLYSKLP